MIKFDYNNITIIINYLRMDNKHSMMTRSKSNLDKNDVFLPQEDINETNHTKEYEELDEYGNLKDFVVYDGDISPFKSKLNHQMKSIQKKKKSKKQNPMGNLLLNYILQKANQQKQSKKLNKNSIIEDTSSSEEIETDEQEMDISIVPINSSDEEEEDSDIEMIDMDEYDEQYDEILDSRYEDEDKDMEYFHNLDISKKETIIEETKKIYEMNDTNVPTRFKIMNSNMDIHTKAIAIENIDKLSEMDIATGEHSKMDHWINGLIKLPFGKYCQLPVLPSSTPEEKKEFIQKTFKILNNSIYGHKEAKTHILQVIGKWIQNPDSGGNVLAIQGPMGNGKTTLVKEGISKALNRPFTFIALGGASDSAYFDGHCYTYEGSHWGRIVQILQDSKCMNPVIYFDELDKISDTQKGDEIIHLLTHITDSSQNTLFQDNYFPGVHIDLSKILFIFSYNDESKVNKILKDRMYVIHTKGFNTEDKLKITKEYLLTDIYQNYNMKSTDIIFTDDIIKLIIKDYTSKEEGVRNLKRCIESIVSKINIYHLTFDPNSKLNDQLSFQLTDFKYPFTINEEHLKSLLNKESNDLPPPNMYL